MLSQIQQFTPPALVTGSKRSIPSFVGRMNQIMKAESATAATGVEIRTDWPTNVPPLPASGGPAGHFVPPPHIDVKA